MSFFGGGTDMPEFFNDETFATIHAVLFRVGT